MDISQFRNQFSVFIVDSDFQVAGSLVETVKATGYEDAQFYPTLESAIAMVRQMPPHLLLLDLERFEASAVNAFLIEIKAVSSEILIILMCPAKQTFTALQQINKGLAYDSVTRPFVSTLEIVQKMDRACERLFFQFESEQLKEQIGSRQPHAASPLEARSLGKRSESRPDLKSVNEFISRISATKELDQCLHIFMEGMSRAVGDVPVLYLRYVPSHMSLLLSHAVLLPLEKFRGIGIDFKKEDAAHLPDLVRAPGWSKPLREMISQVFGRDRYTAFTHMNETDLMGLFVILDEIDIEAETSPALTLRRVFELAYKRDLVMKEKHLLDMTDAVTGLHNRRSFTQKLDEEISRSRRLYMPVSVVTIDIDGVHQLNERLGYQQTDSVLKTIALILKKTARANDIIARTGPDEFVCLLPHTPHMGAAVKAERVRRIIESTKIPLLEKMGMGHITVSCGVSEYPSLSSDAESLLRTADEAMLQVKRAGGNRVCLATAPSGFRMDFAPREPSQGALMRGEVMR